MPSSAQRSLSCPHGAQHPGKGEDVRGDLQGLCPGQGLRATQQHSPFPEVKFSTTWQEQATSRRGGNMREALRNLWALLAACFLPCGPAGSPAERGQGAGTGASSSRVQPPGRTPAQPRGAGDRAAWHRARGARPPGTCPGRVPCGAGRLKPPSSLSVWHETKRSSCLSLTALVQLSASCVCRLL